MLQWRKTLRLIAAVDLILLTDVAIKGFGGPKATLGLLGVTDQLRDRETCLSSSMVTFSGSAMSKDRAIDSNMAHRSVKV